MTTNVLPTRQSDYHWSPRFVALSQKACGPRAFTVTAHKRTTTTHFHRHRRFTHTHHTRTIHFSRGIPLQLVPLRTRSQTFLSTTIISKATGGVSLSHCSCGSTNILLIPLLIISKAFNFLKLQCLTPTIDTSSNLYYINYIAFCCSVPVHKSVLKIVKIETHFQYRSHYPN